jgi:TPP-dependent indolepyruvate ferredoxin oxidoreductase alpha subunit
MSCGAAGREPKLGLVAAGKNYLDLREALADLGIDEAASRGSVSGSTRSACRGRSIRKT